MAGVQAMGTTLTMTKSGSEQEDTVIKHATTIGEMAIESEEIDVTTLDSPNRAKEYAQGAKDAGTISVEANNCYDGQAEALFAVFKSGEVREFTIGYPNEEGEEAATLTFEGYISTFTFGEATTDGLVTCNFDIRTSGLPEYAEVGETA